MSEGSVSNINDPTRVSEYARASSVRFTPPPRVDTTQVGEYARATNQQYTPVRRPDNTNVSVNAVGIAPAGRIDHLAHGADRVVTGQMRFEEGQRSEMPGITADTEPPVIIDERILLKGGLLVFGAREVTFEEGLVCYDTKEQSQINIQGTADGDYDHRPEVMIHGGRSYVPINVENGRLYLDHGFQADVGMTVGENGRAYLDNAAIAGGIHLSGDSPRVVLGENTRVTGDLEFEGRDCEISVWGDGVKISREGRVIIQPGMTVYYNGDSYTDGDELRQAMGDVFSDDFVIGSVPYQVAHAIESIPGRIAETAPPQIRRIGQAVGNSLINQANQPEVERARGERVPRHHMVHRDDIVDNAHAAVSSLINESVSEVLNAGEDLLRLGEDNVDAARRNINRIIERTKRRRNYTPLPFEESVAEPDVLLPDLPASSPQLDAGDLLPVEETGKGSATAQSEESPDGGGRVIEEGRPQVEDNLVAVEAPKGDLPLHLPGNVRAGLDRMKKEIGDKATTADFVEEVPGPSAAESSEDVPPAVFLNVPHRVEGELQAMGEGMREQTIESDLAAEAQTSSAVKPPEVLTSVAIAPAPVATTVRAYNLGKLPSIFPVEPEKAIKVAEAAVADNLAGQTKIVTSAAAITGEAVEAAAKIPVKKVESLDDVKAMLDEAMRTGTVVEREITTTGLAQMVDASWPKIEEGIKDVIHKNLPLLFKWVSGIMKFSINEQNPLNFQIQPKGEVLMNLGVVVDDITGKFANVSINIKAALTSDKQGKDYVIVAETDPKIIEQFGPLKNIDINGRIAPFLGNQTLGSLVGMGITALNRQDLQAAKRPEDVVKKEITDLQIHASGEDAFAIGAAVKATRLNLGTVVNKKDGSVYNVTEIKELKNEEWEIVMTKVGDKKQTKVKLPKLAQELAKAPETADWHW